MAQPVQRLPITLMLSTLYLFRPAISYGVSVSVDKPGAGSSEDVGMTLSSHNQTIMPATTTTTTTTTRQLHTAPQHAAADISH